MYVDQSHSINLSTHLTEESYFSLLINLPSPFVMLKASLYWI